METVLNQTMQDLEIILVDDGSQDACPQLCDQYKKKDSRIIVVHKQNAGLGFARNSGLKIAHGEYVAFLDSDDFVELDMYNSLYKKAIETGADVVFSNFYVEGQPGVWKLNKEVECETSWVGPQVQEFMLDMVASAPKEKLERKYQMSVWHSIYKRSVIEEHQIRFRSEREVLSEDFPFQLDFLLNAEKVVYIPQAYYHYCLNNTSLTASFDESKFESINVLYSVMTEQLSCVEGSIERLDRFYIGYMRGRIKNLFNSSNVEKDRIVKKVLAYKEWDIIFSRYLSSNLPLYQRVHYETLKCKNLMFLKILHISSTWLKRILGRRL